MSDLMTDRDRLAAAFGDLRERGYVADISLAYTVCCREHAMLAISKPVEGEEGMYEAPEKFVFWYVQKDDWSFVGSTDGIPIPERYLDMDDEALDAIMDEIEAATVAERLHTHTTLVHPLNLHWSGNADEIVYVLRQHGLHAAVPNSEHWCIEVTPTSSVKVPTHV